MCQIDGCNKRGFGVSLHEGVIICEDHIQIRPRYRVMTDKVSLKKFKKYITKGFKKHWLPTPPSKPNNNRYDCISYSYLSDEEIKNLITLSEDYECK